MRHRIGRNFDLDDGERTLCLHEAATDSSGRGSSPPAWPEARVDRPWGDLSAPGQEGPHRGCSGSPCQVECPAEPGNMLLSSGSVLSAIAVSCSDRTAAVGDTGCPYDSDPPV